MILEAIELSEETLKEFEHTCQSGRPFATERCGKPAAFYINAHGYVPGSYLSECRTTWIYVCRECFDVWKDQDEDCKVGCGAKVKMFNSIGI